MTFATISLKQIQKEGKKQECKQILIPTVFKKDLFVNVPVIKNLDQMSVSIFGSFQCPSSANKNCSHPAQEKCYLIKTNGEYT